MAASRHTSVSDDPPHVSGAAGADESLVAALIAVSRSLVGISARSLASVEPDVTLQQFRALVVLTDRGEQRISDLARQLGIHPSSTTRLCDRLVSKSLVVRAASSSSRREIDVAIAPAGRAIVDGVMERRRVEIAAVVGRLDHGTDAALIAALAAFASAAQDLPDDAWRLGWSG